MDHVAGLGSGWAWDKEDGGDENEGCEVLPQHTVFLRADRKSLQFYHHKR